MFRIETNTETNSYNVRLSSSIVNLFLIGAVSFLKPRKWLKPIVLMLGLSIALLGGIFFLTGSVDLMLSGFKVAIKRDTGPFLLIAGSAFILIAILSTEKFNLYVGQPKEVEEREKAEEEIGASTDPFSSLELAQKRLNEYYAINQSQAKGSFRWAIFAMFVGLATIVAGVWIFYFRETPNAFLTSLSTAAGIIVNIISGLYIYLHNKTQRRALFYYSQLVKLQHLGLAIRIAESHEDDTNKANAKNKVIDEILSIVKTTAIEESKALAKEES